MAASARRSLTSNLTTLLTRRFHPSFSHLIPHNRDQNTPPSPPRAAAPITGVGFPFAFARSYSSAPGDSGDVGFAKDVAGVVHGTGAADLAPVVGEVAAAAADSAPPVAAVQYFMDAVHSFTGLDWWITIVATTLLIRSATVPLMVYQLKASSKLALLRPEIEKIKAEMDNSVDPDVMKSHQTQIKKLFKDQGVSPFTPLKGMLIQGPLFISFYFAISNMVEKVPSFKEGGAFWFTDLTTPDPFYALPILTGLTFLVNVELNMQEGMEGNPMAGNMKKFSRLMAFLTVPFTASFPKAIFCYWITSNIFSLAYGTVIKRPAVRKFLQIPVATPKPVAASPQSFPFSGTSKQIEPNASPSTLTTQRPQNREKRISSSTVISQRIRNLERSVKAKNKKKR